MKKTLYIILVLLAALPLKLSAQFYLSGDNPASAKWYYIESPHYRLIYPNRLDSTARSYITQLEKYRIPVSRSINFIPGEKDRGKMPVVLHPFTSASNGSVAWAPKRMDLYTSPPAYAPEPLPWTTMLSIHESRHVAQMQFGLSHIFMPFRYVFGEIFAGALAGVYPPKWLLEGDAVVAETALSRSGRGRVAHFMNYYDIAFDQGDFRNYHRWAYGSYWHYTPDHYAFGYMVLSGIRYLYDIPYFSGELFHHYGRRPYDITALNSVSKKLTGKNFRSLTTEVMHFYHDIWTAEAAERAPFTPYNIVTPVSRIFTEYSDNIVVSDEVYTLRESLYKGVTLMKIGPDGKERAVKAFAGQVGKLYWSEELGKLFWSETIPHPRWSMKYDSAIRYMDLKTGITKTLKDGREYESTKAKSKRTLAGKARYFNPSPSPDCAHIAVTRYTDDGRSHLCILDGESGRKATSFALPDSLQLLECAWADEAIYCTALSANGYGIYYLSIDYDDLEEELEEKADHPYFDKEVSYSWKEVLSPSPVMIYDIGMEGDYLMFTSDRTGVTEMYQMDLESGDIYQETSLRHGAEYFAYSPDGQYLICSVPDHTGSPIVRIRTEDLLHRRVDFSRRHSWIVADSLSRQEARLSSKDSVHLRCNTDLSSTSVDIASGAGTVNISEPKRFRKFPRLFNLHSWAPVYFNYDKFSGLTSSVFPDVVSVGAGAYFQNKLGTFTGFLGYAYHPDSVDDTEYKAGRERLPWRHSGHMNFKYSGLYPVFEFSLDFNDRVAWRFYRQFFRDMGNGVVYPQNAFEYRRNVPLISGNLSVYIPINFSSGGWSRGLTPRLSYALSNDLITNSSETYDLFTDPASGNYVAHLSGVKAGKAIPLQTLTADIQFYAMRPAAHADVYPELGFSVETGAAFHPTLGGMIAPSAYAYGVGYLPGFYCNHGWRLTALYNFKIGPATTLNTTADVLPRGYASSFVSAGYSTLSSWAAMQDHSLRLTADYAMPFPVGDFHIGSLFYGTRGVLTPHFDWSFIGGRHLFSTGVTLQFDFSKFICLEFPTTVGVSYYYNYGTSHSWFHAQGIPVSRHYVGPVFSMSF